MTDAISFGSSSQPLPAAQAQQVLQKTQQEQQVQQSQQAKPSQESDGDESTESGAQKATETASRSVPVPTNPSVGGNLNTKA